MLVMVVHGYMVLAGKLAGMEWGVSAGSGCRQAVGVGRWRVFELTSRRCWQAWGIRMLQAW